MSTDEKIVLAIGAILLVVLLVYKPRTNAPAPGISDPVTDYVGVSLTPDNAPTTFGPSYLTYNLPWTFGPPIQNIMPSAARGLLGGALDAVSRLRGSVPSPRPDKTEEA